MGSLFIEQWEIVEIFYHSHFLAISRWRSTSSDPSNSPSSPRLVILWDGDGVAEIDVAETPILLSDGYKRYSFQLVSVKHKRLLVSFQWNDPLFRFTSLCFRTGLVEVQIRDLIGQWRNFFSPRHLQVSTYTPSTHTPPTWCRDWISLHRWLRSLYLGLRLHIHSWRTRPQEKTAQRRTMISHVATKGQRCWKKTRTTLH